MMSQFVEGLRQQLAACRNSNEKLATVVSYHLNTLGSRPEQAKVTQIELRQIDETINRGISLPLLNYFRLIEEVIAEGQKEGFTVATSTSAPPGRSFSVPLTK